MQKEQSLVIIKPDGVQRSLIGEIIRRYERSGLKLVALKLIIPDEEMVKKHYLSQPGWPEAAGNKLIKSYESRGQKSSFSNPKKAGQVILRRNIKFITSGPIVAMIWQGNEAVGVVKKITGGTEPLTSDVGTIRGDLTLDSYDLGDADDRAVRNLVHASGSPEEAKKEIPIWFSKKEILKYHLVQERILYDVNLDGIKE